MKTAPSRIQNNPLDRLDNTQRPQSETHAVDAWLDTKPKTVPQKPKVIKPRKVRFSLRIPSDLVDEIRDMVAAIGGQLRLSIDEFGAAAMRSELKRLRDRHNGGQPFERRTERTLKPGRLAG